MVIKIPTITSLSTKPLASYSFPAAKPCMNRSPIVEPRPMTASPGSTRGSNTVVANMDSCWPQRRLEFAADIIVGALKEKKENTHFGNRGITRQDVRDAARLHIGDTGLLDYVLKSLNNVLVGDQIVRREVNPATRILEYTITEVVTKSEPPPPLLPPPPPPPPSKNLRPPAIIPGSDVYGDVAFIYKHVLMEYPEEESAVESAVWTLLDTKHFVKEWLFNDEDQLLAFLARLVGTGLLDGEVVYLPLHSTLKDLKEGIESALRDTYCAAEGVTVMEIEGLEGMDNDEVLFGAVESGAELQARGFGMRPLTWSGGAMRGRWSAGAGPATTTGRGWWRARCARCGSTRAAAGSKIPTPSCRSSSAPLAAPRSSLPTAAVTSSR